MEFTPALCAEIPALRRLATIWMGQDGEDLLQATCEKALRSQDDFKGGNFQAWLVTIMRTARLDIIKAASCRKQQNHRSLSDLDVVSTPPAQEDAIALTQAVARLGTNSMLLPTALGFSGDELAAEFNTNRRRVQKQVYAERQALFKYMMRP